MAEIRPRAEDASRWVVCVLAPERAARLEVAKMIGIMRYVATLRKPLAANRSRNRKRKSQKFFSGRVQSMVRVMTAMAAKAATVMRAPPIRSAMRPPYGRARDPTSGPRKARDRATVPTEMEENAGK